MKKFFVLIILIVAIAGIFFAVSGKSPQVFRDNIFHSVLTKFITPSEKFWVHRCNSVEKVKIAAEKFSGVEIDANFYPAESFGRKFDISHDSQEAVNFPLEILLYSHKSYPLVKVASNCAFVTLNGKNKASALPAYNVRDKVTSQTLPA